jgi:hypothetical protein
MNTTATPTITATDLDRLVDGELDQGTRSLLIRSLDREPDGWKRCALAFLEAQAWREAAQSMPTMNASTSRPAVPRPRPWARQLVVVAAMVAVAFCAGFVSRGTGRSEPMVRRNDSSPDGTPVQRASATSPNEAAPPAIPDYVRSQMERQGYRVGGGRKVIEVALEDGRRVAVPVDTVSYRYVGQRIH